MVTIEVMISTNASEEEKRRLKIEDNAISEFTGYGFSDNIYDATVSFKCMPRAVPPDFMEIVMQAKEIMETISVLGGICKGIIDFVKKCRGYEKCLRVQTKNGNEIIIDNLENMTAEELCAELEKKIKKQEDR